MIKSVGYTAKTATSPLVPFQFERHDPGPHDIQIEILYCGVCHSDLHLARNEWNSTTYPIVPGHEIVGRAVSVGEKVTKFKVGDLVAVGCLIDSCRQCTGCNEGLEQYCENGFTLTYNSQNKITSKITYGGYADNIVVTEDFVLRIPEKLNLPSVAPLLCAGISTYSPLRYWKIGAKHTVGVVGLGGLGHMAVKFAHALGAHVTIITTSPNKEEDAKRLGASQVLLSTDQEMMKKHANSFDFIINTIPRTHDINPYIALLKRDGVMNIVGALELLQSGLNGRPLAIKRRSITGSILGGIKETQEMLDFCAERDIFPDVEVIPIQKINDAYERLLKGDVKYRFVIDMASLKDKNA